MTYYNKHKAPEQCYKHQLCKATIFNLVALHDHVGIFIQTPKRWWIFCAHKPYFLMPSYIYESHEKYTYLFVTQHEIIGLTCTKYILSHYSTYLTFSIGYTPSVNCIKFPIVCFTNTKDFIDKLSLETKLWNFKV